MSEQAVVEPKRKVPIPPREPKGDAEWFVTARHSPLKVKRLKVTAGSKDQAWQKFLAEVEKATTPETFRHEGKLEGPKHYQESMNWIQAAKRDMPEGVEVIGAEYSRKRLDALRVRGTVTVDQIGFPELASA